MSLNPLATAIDLTTAHGIKQYDKATKGTVTKIDLTNDPEAAEAFMTKLKVDSRKFCFGPVTTHAEIQIAGVEEGTDLTNLLTDYSKITRDRVIETGGVLFGCAFDDVDRTHDHTCVASEDDDVNALRLRNSMLGVYLENSLTSDGQTTLDNYSDEYLYTNTDGNSVSDGMTVLHIILTLIMPTTKASNKNKRAQIRKMHPKDFDGDVSKMISRMQTLKAAIENDSGTEYDDFILYLFKACKQSKFSEFNDYVKDQQSEWEIQDEDGSANDIIVKLMKKWNNNSINEESQEQSSKSKTNADSSNAKSLVLLTALTNAQVGAGGKPEQRSRSVQNLIAEWRKTKSHNDSIFKDGKMYYWCPQHQEGKGLYVTHNLKDHGKPIAEWSNTDRSRNVKQGAPPKQAESSDTPATNKLQLSEQMKAALTTSGIDLKELQEGSAKGGLDFW